MRTPLRIPRVSVAITEGTLTEWLADDGAAVAVGAPLYMLETEKVETEVPAPADGVLHHLGESGATYEVGTEVGWIDGG